MTIDRNPNKDRSVLSLPAPDSATVLEQYTQDSLEFLTYCAREFEEIVPIQLEDDLFCMHRDPRYFVNPDVFNPDRWSDDFEKSLPRGVYFPFSDGPRVCIGKSFAMMEAVLLLATIAQSFQLELAPDWVLEKQASITLRPKTGIQVVLKNAQ